MRFQVNSKINFKTKIQFKILMKLQKGAWSKTTTNEVQESIQKRKVRNINYKHTRRFEAASN